MSCDRRAPVRWNNVSGHTWVTRKLDNKILPKSEHSHLGYPRVGATGYGDAGGTVGGIPHELQALSTEGGGTERTVSDTLERY